MTKRPIENGLILLNRCDPRLHSHSGLHWPKSDILIKICLFHDSVNSTNHEESDLFELDAGWVALSTTADELSSSVIPEITNSE